MKLRSEYDLDLAMISADQTAIWLVCETCGEMISDYWKTAVPLSVFVTDCDNHVCGFTLDSLDEVTGDGV